jgi:Ca2+-binding EF-hand superfamily protein
MKAAFKGVLQAPKKLTPKQVEELKEKFNAADINKDGTLSVNEFKDMLNKLGNNFS